MFFTILLTAIVNCILSINPLLNHRLIMSTDQPNFKGTVDAIPKLVQLLSPLTPEERQRAISAAMIVFGQPAATHPTGPATYGGQEEMLNVSGVSPKATAWMSKYSVTEAQLEHVFSVDADSVDVIAAKLPGKSKRQQTVQAYLLCGLKSYLRSGEVTFTDKEARDICDKVGCYDVANHSNYLKAFGNFISGGKDQGWRLTNPGLSEVAKVIKELDEGSDA